MSLRLAAYRHLFALLGRVVDRRRLGTKPGIQRIDRSVLRALAGASSDVTNSVVRGWFHASSVGELEALWPAVLEWAKAPQERQNGPGRHDREVVVTVFSASAEAAVKRLVDELVACGGRVAFAGYSPWEGTWEDALAVLKPSFFVTAKYEAWPELWVGLQRTGIPLVIVGAMERKSLKAATAICTLLGQALPRMLLLPATESTASALKVLFPGASVQVCGEPRWDRVHERAQRGSSRASQLIEIAKAFPRPWGVLGSVWDEDFEIWKNALPEIQGTLWWVPHRVDGDSVSRFLEGLQAKGITPFVSSSVTRPDVGLILPTSKPCWVVDEMGFLSELYKAADWAFVGGGFGQGVHSAIEPALHGIPVGIGPKGADRFPEIAELNESGQLRILHDQDELRVWLREVAGVPGSKTEEWRTRATRRLGATSRVLQAIQDFVTERNNVLT